MSARTVYLPNGTIDQEEKAWQEDTAWSEYRYDWEWNYWRKAFRCEPLPADVAAYFRNDPEADYEDFLREEED